MATQNNGRYSGNFTLDPAMFGGASAPAGSAQPAPPAGAPSAPPTPPTPPASPFDNQPAGQPEAQQQPRHLGRKIVGGVLVVIGIVAIIVVAVMLWRWAHPAESSPDPNPAPSSSQTSQDGQSGQNSSTPNNTQSPDDNTITERTMAEQAAILDPWFTGIPEANWETKTAAELGGSANSPLGDFCAKFADYVVVLQDGTVITRGNAENGDKIAIIISDYTVPTDWHNMAVGMDKQKINLALVVPSASPDNSNLNGSIWQWDNGISGYVYLTSGTGSAY